MTDPLAQRRASLLRTISEAQLQLDALELVPDLTSYPHGTIIRAEVTHPRRHEPMTYAFLKIVTEQGYGLTRWYHTGYVNSHGRGTGPSAVTYWDGNESFQRWLSEPGRVVETWTVVEKPTVRVRRAHEEVEGDILDVLRRQYGAHYGDDDIEHVRAINAIMHVSGVYE